MFKGLSDHNRLTVPFKTLIDPPLHTFTGVPARDPSPGLQSRRGVAGDRKPPFRYTNVAFELRVPNHRPAASKIPDVEPGRFAAALNLPETEVVEHHIRGGVNVRGTQPGVRLAQLINRLPAPLMASFGRIQFGGEGGRRDPATSSARRTVSAQTSRTVSCPSRETSRRPPPVIFPRTTSHIDSYPSSPGSMPNRTATRSRWGTGCHSAALADGVARIDVDWSFVQFSISTVMRMTRSPGGGGLRDARSGTRRPASSRLR